MTKYAQELYQAIEDLAIAKNYNVLSRYTQLLSSVPLSTMARVDSLCATAETLAEASKGNKEIKKQLADYVVTCFAPLAFYEFG